MLIIIIIGVILFFLCAVLVAILRGGNHSPRTENISMGPYRDQVCRECGQRWHQGPRCPVVDYENYEDDEVEYTDDRSLGMAGPWRSGGGSGTGGLGPL